VGPRRRPGTRGEGRGKGRLSGKELQAKAAPRLARGREGT
jgi:hypothetical protein